eukprot:373004-Pleurochrysis_carterae.AAC.3
MQRAAAFSKLLALEVRQKAAEEAVVQNRNGQKGAKRAERAEKEAARTEVLASVELREPPQVYKSADGNDEERAAAAPRKIIDRSDEDVGRVIDSSDEDVGRVSDASFCPEDAKVSNEDDDESNEYVAKSIEDLVDIGARSKRKEKAQKQQERQPRPHPQPAKPRRLARGGRN